MKTKILTGLAMAAALLMCQPVSAYSAPKASGHTTHTVAVMHHTTSRGSTRVVVAHYSRPSGSRVASYRGGRSSFATTGHTDVASNHYGSTHTTGSAYQSSIAYGGSKYSGNNGHGVYAFSSRPGWSQNKSYYYRGHYYRWYNNGWFIVDPFPVGYGYYGPNPGLYYGPAYYGGNVNVMVQRSLSQQGYYNGPIDGIVGPGTQSAIAAYQHDNGLAVTGTINRALLRNLGLS